MANAVFAAKSIEAKFLSPEKMRGYILNAVLDTGKDAKVRLDMVVSTWNHKVTFYGPKVRYAGGHAFVEIYTTDPAFNYLDGGTTERYAILSQDWMSKTRPGGGYQSGPGAGRVVARGKRYFNKRGIRPMPGIEARRWTETLSDDLSLVLAIRLRTAIERGTIV